MKCTRTTFFSSMKSVTQKPFFFVKTNLWGGDFQGSFTSKFTSRIANLPVKCARKTTHKTAQMHARLHIYRCSIRLKPDLSTPEISGGQMADLNLNPLN